jgi:thiol-disulfide isomerase/thioredoxin
VRNRALLAICFFLSVQLAEANEKLLVTTEPADTILYVFSGSDWCANCIELERKIISNPEFQSILKNNHIQIEIIDFPQRKKLKSEIVKYNSTIAEKFNFEGVYPTLVVFSAHSKKHKQIIYQNETAQVFSNKIIQEAATLYE